MKKNMSLLEWHNEQSVGVKELDEQHKKMFGLINRLFESMRESKYQEDIGEILKELDDYGKYHFETEEKYFEQFEYPEKEAHKRSHDGYRQKIRDLMKKEKNAALSFDMLDFLENWWIDHITNVDKQYTKFFNEHGLT